MRDSQGEPDVAAAPAPQPARPPESGAAAEASEVSAESEATAQLAAAEQSARASTRASARASRRFVLPDDRRDPTWWVRHAEKIRVAEWALTAAFLAAAGYFLWLWLFPAPGPTTVARPTREDFRAALLALPAATPAASWKAPAAPGRWRLIVLHHTATAQGDPAAIDRYHRENNKWENGLGYHFLIGNGHGMPDGAVFAGGRWTRQLDGAHVRAAGDGKENGNANSFSIGIALVGNFQSALPTPAQLAALRGLLAFLMREYAIPASSVVGHGALSARPTACPGQFFFTEEVKRALEEN